MKKTQKLAVALAVVAAICGVLAFGYLMFNTMSHMGDDAVAQMNAEERRSLERVGQLRKTMEAAQVYKILGEPTSDLVVMAKWEGFGGSRLSELRIYFLDGHPRTVRWLKLGYFVYEKEL